MTIGHCKHGEFVLTEGCQLCIHEAVDKKLVEVAEGFRTLFDGVEPTLVKVQYYSTTTGELSSREYTYFTEDILAVGDLVSLPVRNTTGKAKVSAIDVSKEEIAEFRDKVKTIPSGSLLGKLEEEDVVVAQVTIDRHYGLIPEPLSKEARKVLTGGRDEMIKAATETALATVPGADIQAMDYYNEALILQQYAENRVITTPGDKQAANDDLIIIGQLKRAMEGKRVELIKPMQDEVKAIQETYKTLMFPVLEADRITRDKMLAFDKEQNRLTAEQERINALRLEAAQKEMELKGELTESVNLVEVIPEAPSITRSQMGVSSQRQNWKYEVVDFALLPDAYKVADSSQLTAIAKAHHDKKEVPGVRFYNDPGITARQR